MDEKGVIEVKTREGMVLLSSSVWQLLSMSILNSYLNFDIGGVKVFIDGIEIKHPESMENED